jgi:hypothetical protein
MNYWPEFTADETTITLSDHPFYDLGYAIYVTARHFENKDDEYPASFATHTFVYATPEAAEYAYNGAQYVRSLFSALADDSLTAYVSIEAHLDKMPYRVEIPE